MTTDIEQQYLAAAKEMSWGAGSVVPENYAIAYAHRIAKIERERLGVGFEEALRDAPAVVTEGDRDQHFYLAGAAASAVALEKAREALEKIRDGMEGGEIDICFEALAAIEALKGEK